MPNEKKKKLLEKISLPPEITEVLRVTLTYVGLFVGGLILSLGDLFSGLSPFGAAFALSVPLSYLPAAAGGAILGYLISEESTGVVRYAAALIIGAIILFTVQHLLSRKYKPSFAAIVTSVCLSATGIAVAIGASQSAADILLYIAEGILGGCYCLFFQYAARILSQIRVRRLLKSVEWICLLLAAAAFLVAVSPLTVFGVSPARLLCAFAILLCACFGGETAGAIAGICFGCVMGFADQTILLGGSWALGGLVAGLCAKNGRFSCVIGFLLSHAVVLLFADEGNFLVYSAIEAGIASIALLVLPKKACDYFASYFVHPGATPETDSMRELLSEKLHAASATVYEVSGSVRAVSRALAGISKRKEKEVYAPVKDAVCRHCSRMNRCWEYNFENTLDAFNRMILCRKNGEMPGRDNLPPYFASHCTSVEELIECFNTCYSAREFQDAAETKIAEARSVAADQFTSLSVMLENLAEELQRDVIFAPETAKKAAGAVESEGIQVLDCLCIINEGGYAILQVFCAPARKKISASALAKSVSEATGIAFDPPVIGRSSGEKILLLFCECPPCMVQAAASQLTGEGESVCGDAYDYFNDGRGHYIMILSDGMGTGSRAAVDGTMTTGLAGKLIRAGFSFECVVKTVNSALMVKSKDESLSTLDIISIDLFNGEATFYKAGAAASLICRRGKTIRVERSSLPLGILRDVEFERVTGKIGDGDMLLMMSDGAMSIPPDELRRCLTECAENPPAEIAAAVTNLAKEYAPARSDDITVLAAVIRKKAS